MSRARFASIGTIRLQSMLAECLSALAQRRKAPFNVNLLRAELARRKTDRSRHLISAGGSKVIHEDTAGRPSVRGKPAPGVADDFKTAAQIEAEERQIGHVQSVDDLSHLGSPRR